ncbi:MAG: polyprenyl synthetase family protein [Bacilli bacterium]
MYFIKKEGNQVSWLETNVENYLKIDEWTDLVTLLSLKDDEVVVIGSDNQELITSCYELVKFLILYTDVKNRLSFEMRDYNTNLGCEDNHYIKALLDCFIDLNSDGKFIRGFLIILGYLLMKQDSYDEAIPLALAFELFQTSVLIHDDIIDNASKRRGKKTIVARYMEKYEQAKHLGVSLAICAGDLGFYKANEILIEYYHDNKTLLKYFNDIIINTIRGETLDVVLPHLLKYNYFDDTTLEKYVMEIYRLKTSWYSVVGPIGVGMILGGANHEQVEAMEDFAYGLGVAFQIKDDILGIYSNKVKAEKTASDISEFKQTIMYSYVYENCPTYLTSLQKYYGQDNLKDEDIEIVKSIFKESGALDYANNMMDRLFKVARHKLESLSFIEKNYQDILKGFIVYLEQRDH